MNQLEMAHLPYRESGLGFRVEGGVGASTGALRQSRPYKAGRGNDASPDTIDDPEVVNPLEQQDLAVSSYINLKKMFPISRRLILKKMLPWLSGFALLLGIYWHNFGSLSIADAIYAFQHPYSESYPLVEVILYGSAFLILSAVFIFYTLQRYFFNYRIEGFRLIIQRGIILIEEGSLPLLPIAEVYLRRELLDFLVGLYQVHVAVPVNSTKRFACIEGVTHRNATLLIEYLSAQLSKQVVATTAGHQRNSSSGVASIN